MTGSVRPTAVRWLTVVALAILVPGGSAAAFLVARDSVDRTPKTLPAAAVSSQRLTAVDPAIVLPPRAVVR